MTYMIEDFYFLAKNQINLTASSIGISKSKWTSIDEREIERDEYKGKMRSLRFDHLPIISENNNVYEYFKTLQSNNYDNIVRYKISIDDVISINTDIRDVINKFSSLNRTFYFLALHNQILGLITIGNINSKQVQVYIFSLICDLERALGDFINRNLSSEKIETYIYSKIDPEDVMDKYRLMLENYRQLVLLDLDNKLTEHFFLLIFLI